MPRIWIALATLSSLAMPAMAQQGPVGAAAPDSFPPVVARVNGLEIAKDDLVRRAEALKQGLAPEDVGPDFYQKVLEGIVRGELLSQSATDKGFAATPSEVDLEIGNRGQQMGGAAALETALQSSGMTMAEYRVDVEKELSVQKLIEEDFMPSLTISDEAKRTFYAGNTESMRSPLEFRAAHILILVEEGAEPEVKSERQKKAQALLSMIEMGQDFAELAEKNSGDPGSKDNAGELPWMGEGQTVPPFEAAMKSLEPGQLSGVVETQFGYHIIKLLERRGGVVTPFEEIEPRIEEFLKQQGLRDKIDQEIELLLGAAAVEVLI